MDDGIRAKAMIIDPAAFEMLASGSSSRENNIRISRAMRKAKAEVLFELMAGWSQSDFVRAAASDDGENLLHAIVGLLGEYPIVREHAQ